MTTKLLSLAALLFISSTLFAQGLQLGIKGGANLGKISGQSFKDEFTLGYHVGAFATIGLGERLAIQPEVMLSQTNVDTATNFNQVIEFRNASKINLQFLTIPILLNYNLGKSLTLQAGPQFGILLDKDKNLLENGEEAFKSGDFSMMAGLQLNLLKFRVYGRFIGGLTDLNRIENSETWKTSAIQVGLGIVL